MSLIDCYFFGFCRKISLPGFEGKSESIELGGDDPDDHLFVEHVIY